jgi:hypothetical protein
MRFILRNTFALTLAAVLGGPAAPQSLEVGFDFSSAALPFWEVGARTEGQEVESQPQKPADAATPVSSNTARHLNIFVLVGDRAVNSIASGFATSVIVEVRDERNLPVEGAEVVFQLPSVGPSGIFADQQSTWTGRTDFNGQVIAPKYAPNRQKGRFAIQITASRAGVMAHAVAAQTNSFQSVVEATPRHSGWWWKAVIVAGACGAAGGIVWATRGGGNSVTLSPGSVSIGPPR